MIASTKFSYLFLLILFFTRVSAQSDWLKLSFDEKVAQPEMFIFEPHYDENNKIEYYSFANVLKIEYQKNSKGLPEKKIIRQWDKYNYQWKIATETSFKYDHQDRLIEERTEQLFPKVYNGNTVEYPKTTIMLKQIHYDEQTHTEKIHTTINVPDLPLNRGYSDSTTMIRYMNKFNLPDSMVMQIEREHLTHYNKSIYTYDKKKRNILTEYFFKSDTVLWKTATLKVEYKKNKIIYTQTPISYEEETTEDNDSIYYQYEKPKEVVFEISYDDQERITSKKIKSGSNIILFSEYHYDQYGNTHVTYEQDAKLMSLFSSVLPNIKIPDMFRYLKYSVQYDNHCARGLYYIKNKKGELLQLAEITNCHSPEGLLLSNDMTRYYESDGDFDDRERVEFRYNKDGLSGEYIVYRTREEEEAKDIMNQQRTKVIFKNDTLGNQLYKEEYDYSYEKQWKPTEKTTKAFDKNGYEIFYKNEHYDDNQWKVSWETQYVRDSLNRILVQEEAEYRYCYRYNNRHTRTLIEKYRRDDNRKSWKGIYKDSMVYNNADEVIEEIEYQWIDERSDWQPKSRIVQDKQSEGNEQTTMYQWENDRWTPLHLNYKKEVITTDTTIIESGSLEWNKDNNQWDVEMLNRSTTLKYDSDILETYYWNQKLKVLEGEKHIITQPGGNTKVYSVWDYDSCRWNDTIRYTLLLNKKNKNWSYWLHHPIYLVNLPDDSCYHIFENYDRQHRQWIPEKRFEITNPCDSIYQVQLETWDAQHAVWAKKTKLKLYRNQDSENYKNELSSYDKVTSTWKPQYKSEDGKLKGETGIFYLKWNTQKQEWKPLFFNGKNDDYLWNDKINGWKEKDYWTPVSEEIREMHKALFPDIKVDYQEIIKLNQWKREEAITQ